MDQKCVSRSPNSDSLLLMFKTLVRLKTAVLGFVLALIVTPSLLANSLKGQDDPALKAAIDLWLDNNTGSALVASQTAEVDSTTSAVSGPACDTTIR